VWGGHSKIQDKEIILSN